MQADHSQGGNANAHQTRRRGAWARGEAVMPRGDWTRVRPAPGQTSWKHHHAVQLSHMLLHTPRQHSCDQPHPLPLQQVGGQKHAASRRSEAALWRVQGWQPRQLQRMRGVTVQGSPCATVGSVLCKAAHRGGRGSRGYSIPSLLEDAWCKQTESFAHPIQVSAPNVNARSAAIRTPVRLDT